jgi:hypothetical protein
MSYRRRLATLEGRLRPVTWDRLSELHREWYREFETSPAIETVLQFANVLAAMRFRAQGGMSLAPRQHHVDDWKLVTTAEQRDARIAVEVDRLAAMMGEYDLDTALTLWTETAKREGWLPLSGPTYSVDRRGFDQLFRLHRSRGDEARMRDDPPSRLWRADHPSWRPNMTFGETLEETVRRRG